MNDKHNNIIAIVLALLLILSTSWVIYKQIQEHYTKDDPKLKEMKKIFEDFFKQDRYWNAPLDMLNKTNIMEEIEMYRGNKSYTINKEKIYICLKDENGNYFNNNMLIYVIAHEISHVICTEIGHTELFQNIFEELLQELTKAKIYNPSIPIDQNYCEDGDPEM
jgi:hypothetical protein